MQAARTLFARDSAISTILAPDLDPVVLELFLIHFSALGVAMTKLVEDWIRRAGERCEQIGLTELGRSLRLHAKHEAGHHLMLIEDTRRLVARWNARRTPPIDADQVLAQPVADGVRMYRKLHEEVIASDTPFGQLAIEYEIEGLSVRYGPPLIAQCMRLLGSTVMAGLSFLQQHVFLDVGHTRFNEQQLERLLDQDPKYVMPLVSAGERALDAYGAFLNDCVRLARAQAGGSV